MCVNYYARTTYKVHLYNDYGAISAPWTHALQLTGHVSASHLKSCDFIQHSQVSSLTRAASCAAVCVFIIVTSSCGSF